METFMDFLNELFLSAAFRSALITVITTIVLIIGTRLQQYLNELTEKVRQQKITSLKDNLDESAQDLIVTAEKRIIEDALTKENWVVEMLRFQYANQLDKTPELTDAQLLAIVQSNYEELRSAIPEERWEKMSEEAKLKGQPLDSAVASA
ncbi:hypothetical protein GF357_04970 [Candidatus Dojkabacteria bacterium]|nr:hypothetical protein [Candidatus Dojkabacteria bacterium]